MTYRDLREFLTQLEGRGELKRIVAEVSPRLEMTEIADRVLRAGGPALLFERPAGHRMPVLANLFGTVERVAAAMGVASLAALRDMGRLLAYLKDDEPRRGHPGERHRYPGEQMGPGRQAVPAVQVDPEEDGLDEKAKPSKVNGNPKIAPKRPMSPGQRIPSSKDRIVPDTAPTAKSTPITLAHRRASRRYKGSPLRRAFHSA